MASGNAKRFVEMGVGPRLAREYAAQITAGIGNQRRLVELGVVPSAAKLLASVFSGGSVSNSRLTEAGIVPRVVREVKAQVGGSTPPTLTITGTPGPATQNSAYSFTPTVTGGSGTKTFTSTGTALPAGLALNSSTGAITGTPTIAATTSGIAITVTDSSGTATLSGLSIVVSAAVANIFMVGASNSNIGNGFVTNSATETEWKQRTVHLLGFEASEIKPALMNHFATNTAEFQTAATVSIVKASLEWVGVGVAPLTVSASRTFDVPANVFQVQCDTLTPASFGSGLAAFPADAKFFLRSIFTTPTSGITAIGTLAPVVASPTATVGYSGPDDICKAVRYVPANRIDDVDATGAMTFPSGTSQDYTLPVFILAKPTSAAAKSILIIGDSIPFGTGELSQMTAMTGRGFADRAAQNGSSASGIIAIGHSTRASDTLQSWLANNVMRRQALAQCNIVLVEMGTNDFGTSGAGSTLSAMQTRAQQLWTLIGTYSNVKRIYHTNLFPRPSGTTDSWASKAGQTFTGATDWQTGGIPDQYVAWLQSQVGTAIAGVIDIRTAVGDPTDSHYWATTGVANAPTTDGIHPRGTLHAAAGAALRTGLQAVTL